MRVRTSADTIRNMERLLAFDEAAGSKGTWADEDAGSRMAPAHELEGVAHNSEGRTSSAKHSPTGRRSPVSGGKTLGSSAMMDRF